MVRIKLRKPSESSSRSHWLEWLGKKLTSWMLEELTEQLYVYPQDLTIGMVANHGWWLISEFEEDPDLRSQDVIYRIDEVSALEENNFTHICMYTAERCPENFYSAKIFL